jgi:hypothetical protein
MEAPIGDTPHAIFGTGLLVADLDDGRPDSQATLTVLRSPDPDAGADLVSSEAPGASIVSRLAVTRFDDAVGELAPGEFFDGDAAEIRIAVGAEYLRFGEAALTPFFASGEPRTAMSTDTPSEERLVATVEDTVALTFEETLRGDRLAFPLEDPIPVEYAIDAAHCPVLDALP